MSEIILCQNEVHLALSSLNTWMKDEPVAKNMVRCWLGGGSTHRTLEVGDFQVALGGASPSTLFPSSHSWTPPSSARSPSAWCSSSPPGTTP